MVACTAKKASYAPALQIIIFCVWILKYHKWCQFFKISFINLHAIVSWSFSPLGTHPVNILTRVFYITSFTMNTVLSIYLKSFPTTILCFYIFIYTWKKQNILVTSLRLARLIVLNATFNTSDKSTFGILNK